jgi:hypothetical protein
MTQFWPDFESCCSELANKVMMGQSRTASVLFGHNYRGELHISSGPSYALVGPNRLNTSLAKAAWPTKDTEPEPESNPILKTTPPFPFPTAMIKQG